MDGKSTKRQRKIAENFNPIYRAHENATNVTDRRQTDRTAIEYSEREREFTFAKMWYTKMHCGPYICLQLKGFTAFAV